MTIAKFTQVTRTQPCVQNLHEWYVQNLHMPLRFLAIGLGILIAGSHLTPSAEPLRERGMML